ncbi:hypothetical protein CJ030_MR7G024827 [Morella rubra]|uniref:Uncharacterized protein n=1 Tax=Morella rubra TaxID=262757 RepID=A0A6A1V4S0_9ROSI|nr:hypothetical protein CJ030_MR7G024827 [Morella rubra]
MALDNSYNSWADQWDPEPMPGNKSRGGRGQKGKHSKRVEEGWGKTKAVASTGAKKVKEGASVSFHWIKDKCHKTKR